MRPCLALVLLLLLAVPPPALGAGEEQAIARFFQAERVEAAWFTPEMLQAAPTETLQAYRDQLLAEQGDFRGAVEMAGRWQVRLERALVAVELLLDERGRIASLWLGPPLRLDRTLAQVAADVAALPGEVSLLVVQDGEPLIETAADRNLAVGSAFKLAVLTTLVETIETSGLRWEETTRLKYRHRSLPTGILQDWPVGTPLSVESLAALMISISDNTATDALIDFLGVTRIEPHLPPESRPLLTTRQYFLLAGAKHAAERLDYDQLSEDGRRAVLVGLRSEKPTLADFLAGAAGPDFGWRLSTRSLCAMMDPLLGLDLLAINPGLAYPRDWRLLGYKGGSAPGAMNMTTGLESFDGRRHCVAMTWNDAGGIDPQRFAQLYGELLALLPRD